MDLKSKICTIGGGSGMPTINRSLVGAGFRDISSIVTTFDSGGDTGRLRTDERGKVLAFSDYWRSLLSLWIDGRQKNIWEEMLSFRDGRTRNFGNLFFQFMAERTGDLSKVDGLFAKLTGANLAGDVIPVSVEPADVCFSTISGKNYRGEHNLDALRMSKDKVKEIWLDQDVKTNKNAIKALMRSDYVIVCPGSMYGSVITNFLPLGMVEAFNKSGAKKILMTNIMSVANENDNFDQYDYASVFVKYLKTKKPFEKIVMTDLDKLDQHELDMVLKYYRMEHSKPIRISSKNNFRDTIVADVAIIEKKHMRLRHSEEKLSIFFRSVDF
jgi:uncharacterized cofD-like protein